MTASAPPEKIRWTKIVRKMLRSRFKLQQVSRRFDLPPMTGNPLGAQRRSDTLFILGSGGSVHDLSTEDWAKIRESDSLGFNFWLVHDFVPDVYVFEPTDPAHPTDEHACLIANLQLRQQDYAAVPIILKDGERHKPTVLESFLDEVPERLRRNLRFTLDFEIPGNDESQFIAAVRSLDRWGLWRSARMPLPRKRGSIFYLLVLALRAGYRDVVLCGVDLNNTDYFYDIRRAEYEAKGRAAPRPPKLGAVHKTNDPQFGELTISKAIQALNNVVLKPAGMRVHVAFKSSGLYPALPAYFDR